MTDTPARRQSRDPLERYDTPYWVTRALIEYGPLPRVRCSRPMWRGWQHDLAIGREEQAA